VLKDGSIQLDLTWLNLELDLISRHTYVLMFGQHLQDECELSANVLLCCSQCFKSCDVC